jgi:hypothetical protein
MSTNDILSSEIRVSEAYCLAIPGIYMTVILLRTHLIQMPSKNSQENAIEINAARE